MGRAGEKVEVCRRGETVAMLSPPVKAPAQTSELCGAPEIHLRRQGPRDDSHGDAGRRTRRAMSLYADTGFICSLHAPDANTPRVLARMTRLREPLFFTALHRLGFFTANAALRLRVFRDEITPEQRELSIRAMLSDLAADVFRFAEPSWPEAFLEAERLSAAHSESLGTRSFDILHVACALLLGAKTFFSFDKRQCALAMAAGLVVPSL